MDAALASVATGSPWRLRDPPGSARLARSGQRRAVVLREGAVASHRSAATWVRAPSDRIRDNATAITGRLTLRFGWADVDAQACEVAQDVAVVLWSRVGAASVDDADPAAGSPGDLDDG